MLPVRSRVDLRATAMKGTPYSPKARSFLELQHQIDSCNILINTLLKSLPSANKKMVHSTAPTDRALMYSYGPPHMAEQKQDDLVEHTYSSYVRIRDVAMKTCQRRWMIGRSGERGSGISMLAARHDDDDDDDDITPKLKVNRLDWNLNSSHGSSPPT